LGELKETTYNNAMKHGRT